MEFRRILGLPPYVFATMNDLKAAARHDGKDIIDLGFGNPDLPSPDVAVEKLPRLRTVEPSAHSPPLSCHLNHNKLPCLSALCLNLRTHCPGNRDICFGACSTASRVGA